MNGTKEIDADVCLGIFLNGGELSALYSFSGYEYFKLGCYVHNDVTLCACNDTDFCSDQIRNPQVK